MLGKLTGPIRLAAGKAIAGAGRWRLLLAASVVLTLVVGAYTYGALSRTVRLSEAPSFGQPIIAFDPTSRGAVAYRELAKEVSGGPA